MNEKDKNTGNALKQALENRRGQGLPSNFSFKMMEKVRLEAEKKRKRQRAIIWISLITASLAILGLLVYCLVFVLGFNPVDYISHFFRMENYRTALPRETLDFYYYIGFLVIILLLIDYWFRSKRRKYFDE